MKQHITPKQANRLGKKRFYELFPDLVVREDWASYHHKKISIGKLIEIIEKSFLIQLTTTNNRWTVQLFELDEVSLNTPIYTIYAVELVDALFDALLDPKTII